MASSQPNPVATARTLGGAEAAFDLIHQLVLDAVTTGRIPAADAFDAAADAVRVAEAVRGTEPALPRVVELERRSGGDR